MKQKLIKLIEFWLESTINYFVILSIVVIFSLMGCVAFNFLDKQIIITSTFVMFALTIVFYFLPKLILKIFDDK